MKKKLVLLLLITCILTLCLVGISLEYLISKYYKDQADNEFQQVFSHLVEMLGSSEHALSVQANHLASQQEIISSVNMIYQYANPDNYQSLIYDEEKRSIAKQISNLGINTQVDLIAIYTASGELVSFFIKDKLPLSGYLSYENNNKLILSAPNADFSIPEPLKQAPLAEERQDLPENLGTPRYHYLNNQLAIETVAPIIRRYPDGKSDYVGNIVFSKIITNEFLEKASKGTNIELSLHNSSNITPQLLHLPDIKQHEIPKLDLHSSSPSYLTIADKNNFLALLNMAVTDGQESLFIAALPKQHVNDAINNANAAVLPVLLIAGILIIPIGLVAANRAINKPVERLLMGVEDMRHGNYSINIPAGGNDELSMLAHAFNDMAGDIQRRTQELVESESKHRTLLENVPQKIFYKDTNSAYISCNRSYAADLGITPEQIMGKTDYDFFPRELADKYRANDQEVMRTGEIADLDEDYTQGGRRYTIHTVKTPVYDNAGQCIGTLGVFWDITERKQAEERLKQAATVFENTAEGVIITDTQPRILAVNKAFTEITGFTEEEVLGKSPSIRRSDRQNEFFYREMWDTLLSTGRWSGEIWNRKKSGEVAPEWMTITAVYDEQNVVSSYVSVFMDISSIKRSEAQLEHMAHHDPLTDLPNRILINDRLKHAIERVEGTRAKIALLFLDLDRFKNVNDTLGHPIGDKLLEEVASRLHAELRHGDTLGRLGGDEFIVIIEGFDRISEVEHLAEKMLETMIAPFNIKGHEFYLGASIGISLYPDDGREISTLIRNADSAMYRAKEQGRNNFQFYTSSLTIEATERLNLEAALRHAVDHDELVLHYQPQIDLRTMEMVGMEALVRWNSKKHGLVPPDKFIPISEETGVILQIGEWVLRTACSQAREWMDSGITFQHISVNISSIQVQRGNLVELVRNVLEETSLPPEILELEITESVLMSQPELVSDILGQLRTMGIALAVDDFGTGYSSLSYLKGFPLTSLKIDRSFVRDLPDDKNDEAITNAVIALGHSLGLSIIAEGVETKEQQEYLIQKGCEQAQGYYYSKPVPAEEIPAFLNSSRQKIINS